MNCEACCENLSALLDRELGGAMVNEVRGHLDGCPPCRAELDDLERSARIVEARARSLEPAPEMWRAVRARIAGAEPRLGLVAALRRMRWIPAAVAAAAVLALGIGGYLHRREEARRAVELRELERYMDDYVATRKLEERALHGAFATPPAIPRNAGPPPARLRADLHREHADNPFIVADEFSPASPFGPVDAAESAVEAAK